MNFEALTNYLDQLAAKNITPGCDLLVWVDHKPVYRHFAGEAHPGVPMNGTETYWLYSTSKVITMTAVMQLVERGLIGLDDPVSKYLPAYANLTVDDGSGPRPARTVMTVRHLMSMTGGLDYDLASPSICECLKEHGPAATTQQLAEAFIGKPLLFDPGTHFNYSLCHDVAAAVVEVAAGMSFGEFVQRNILDPLEIKCLTFHPTPAQKARIAARYVWDERTAQPVPQDNQTVAYQLSDAHESGGAGLLGDAESYIRVSDALANGGVGCTGARILTPESIDLMRSNQMGEVQYSDFVLFNKVGYSYGLGVRTLIDPDSSRSPVGEFGWDGAAGAWTMMDPDNHIAAFFADHVLGCTPIYLEHHPAIRDLIYECLSL